MTQNQRDAAAVARWFVYEMNHGAADPRTVVREPVKLPLGRPPVEPAGPVTEQSVQPVPVGALRPWLTGRGLRQPGAADPGPQIIEHTRVHGHRERLDPNL